MSSVLANYALIDGKCLRIINFFYSLSLLYNVFHTLFKQTAGGAKLSHFRGREETLEEKLLENCTYCWEFLFQLAVKLVKFGIA